MPLPAVHSLPPHSVSSTEPETRSTLPVSMSATTEQVAEFSYARK